VATPQAGSIQVTVPGRGAGPSTTNATVWGPPRRS